MENEIPSQLSDFLLKFSKKNNLPEDWAERFKQVFIRWINETSEQVKSDLLSCLRELEASSKKPGRVRKFFNAIMREIVKHFDKDPGGKSRYKWADKAFIMRHELKLDYRHIYPAVCKEATGKCLEELNPNEQNEFEIRCRSLVYCRRQEALKPKSKKVLEDAGSPLIRSSSKLLENEIGSLNAF